MQVFYVKQEADEASQKSRFLVNLSGKENLLRMELWKVSFDNFERSP